MPASPNDRPLLEVRDLLVRRSGREVLHGLNLEVRAGEIFGLLGPNGAGKTTLFHVLTGLLNPTSGELRLDGRSVAPSDPELRARAGVVFQEPALDPRLSARVNLMLAAGLYRVGRRQAAERAEELLERARLLDRADEPVSRFSGGMRRRVELARALIHRPSILILDEPTTGLDEGAYRSFWNDLETLRTERELTLLLTTHRADEAERCDRLAILDAGRVVACDGPDRLRDRVQGDLLILHAVDAEAAARRIEQHLGLSTQRVDGRLVLRRERAHELVPRIVEVLPPRALHSVEMRRTGMAEVFLELTGHELDDEPASKEGRAT